MPRKIPSRQRAESRLARVTSQALRSSHEPEPLPSRRPSSRRRSPRPRRVPRRVRDHRCDAEAAPGPRQRRHDEPLGRQGQDARQRALSRVFRRQGKDRHRRRGQLHDGARPPRPSQGNRCGEGRYSAGTHPHLGDAHPHRAFEHGVSRHGCGSGLFALSREEAGRGHPRTAREAAARKNRLGRDRCGRLHRPAPLGYSSEIHARGSLRQSHGAGEHARGDELGPRHRPERSGGSHAASDLRADRRGQAARAAREFLDALLRRPGHQRRLLRAVFQRASGPTRSRQDRIRRDDVAWLQRRHLAS